MSQSTPELVETITDDWGTYTLAWYCTPPSDGELFQVTRQEWDGGFTERRILAWRLWSPPRALHPSSSMLDVLTWWV